MVARSQARPSRRARPGGVGDDSRPGPSIRSGSLTVAPRVLLISAEYPPVPGGVGDYTARLAESLAGAGVSVAVLTSLSSDAGPNGAVTVYPIIRRWDWSLARRARAAIEEFQPDLLHLQYQTGMYGMHPAIAILPTWLSRMASAQSRRGFPFVTTFHDLRHPYLFPKAGPLRACVTRHLARASTRSIATNGADAALLRRWRANSALIPIGSNIPVAAVREAGAIRARYAVPAGAILLTTFGLMNRSKGIETAIEALALLRREGTEAYLLLIGAGAGVNDPTNRMTEDAVDRQCEAMGLTAFVRKTGRLPAAAVAAALAASDVCLLPYHDGASPRRGSLLAALAQGIPVVTTTPAPGVYDGLPPFRNGEVARCVPAGDARAIAAGVRAILRDDALAARLRVGAATYAARFAWPVIAARTLALYETLGVPASTRAGAPVVASGAEH